MTPDASNSASIAPDARWALIERFLNGECTPAEEQQAGTLLSSETGGAFARMVSEQLAARRPTPAEVERAAEQFRSHRAMKETGADSQHTKKVGQGIGARDGRAWYARSLGERAQRGRSSLGRETLRGGLPVMVLLVMALASVLFQYAKPAVSVSLPSRTYATIAGQQAATMLSDGTHVLLGPATTLIAASSPTHSGLDIRVRGQALFTVQHTNNRRVRVYVGHAVVQVLGTRFGVRQYDADSVARVIVTDGRVSLSGVQHAQLADASRILTANMLGVVNDSGIVQIVPAVIANDYLGWTTGQLVFRGTLARDAVLELGRAYGVEIRIVDSALAAQRLNWTVPIAKQSLRSILETLADILDARVIRASRVITIIPGPPATPRHLRAPFFSNLEHHYGK